MKKLNSTYFRFFLFRYGIIFLLILVIIGPICLLGQEKNVVLFTITVISGLFFFLTLIFLDYRRLKKKTKLVNVFLGDHFFLIDQKKFLFEQIECITPLLVGEAINDKHTFNIIEIKVKDDKTYYFLDQPLDWKFKSPTIKLLNKIPQLSSKINEEENIYTRLLSLNDKRKRNYKS